MPQNNIFLQKLGKYDPELKFPKNGFPRFVFPHFCIFPFSLLHRSFKIINLFFFLKVIFWLG